MISYYTKDQDIADLLSQEGVQVVRTSTMVEMLKIPSLIKRVEPTLVKQEELFFPLFQKVGVTKFQPRQKTNFPLGVVAEYKTDDFTIQLGAIDHKTIYGAGIEVTKKGSGLGTELINEILDWCEDNGYEFHQVPLPINALGKKMGKKVYQSSKKLHKDMMKIMPQFLRLVEYYKSLGFVWSNKLGFSTMKYEV